MADQRILQGTAATLTWQPTDSDGEPAAPTGTVTVAVTASDGSDVLTAGTATSGSGTNPRTAGLTAAQTANLDLLTATWTDGDSSHTTTVEVVGGYFFTVAEARASDEFLADETKVDNDTLLRIRTEIEDEIERICGRAFVPRFARSTFYGTYGTVGLMPNVRSIPAVSSTWAGASTYVWTETEIAALAIDQAAGAVGPFAGDFVIAYTHGLDRPPADVKTAALILLREKATRPWRAVSDRASSYSSDEQGPVELAPPAPWSTGIPDVDAVLGRYSMRVHAV